MRYFLLFCLLVPIFLFADNPRLPGQESQTDSLKNLLTVSEGSKKLDILQTLIRKYLFKSADSCIKYGQLAADLANKLKNTEQEAIAYKTIGYASYRLGDYDQSIKYYEKALESYKEAKQYFDATTVSNYLGDAYTMKTDYTKAIAYLTAAEESCDTLLNTHHKRISVRRLYSIILTNIGNLYYELDSIEKPLIYFTKALAYAKETGDSTRITASFSNIGMIYKKQEKYDLALNKYFKALEVSQKIGNRDYQIAILNNIANIYGKTGKSDTPLIYYQKAKKITIETGNKYKLAQVNYNISHTYFNLGNYSVALDYALSSLETSMQTKSPKVIYDNYELLSMIYEKLGRNKQSLEYHKRFAKLKDSVIGLETRGKIAYLQIKYETEKKEKENTLLHHEVEIIENDIKRVNLLLIIYHIVISVIVVSSIIIFVLLRKKSKAYYALVRQNLKSLKIEKKLEENILGQSEHSSPQQSDPDNKYKELDMRLIKFLIEEKPYLLEDVSQEEFCQKLGTNRTYLSQMINRNYNLSFNDLLCEYRVRAARELLADPAKMHFSIEGIGGMAGFKNNATFHRKFKKQLALTPKQFRDKVPKSK